MNQAAGIIQLDISRVFSATPSDVYSAWTKAEFLSRWWGAGCAYVGGDIEVDLRVGGKYQLQMKHVGKDILHTTVGEFLEVVENEKLVYTWSWSDNPEPSEITEVTVLFKEHSDGCEVLLTHRNFETEETCEMHRGGWKACMGQLHVSMFSNYPDVLAATAGQFRTSAWLVASLVGGIDNDNAAQRLGDGNSLVWLLGHNLNCRYMCMGLLGVEGESPFKDTFKTGIPASEQTDLPSWDETYKAWGASELPFLEALENVSEAHLNSPAPKGFPHHPKNIMAALAFMSFHESYHVGQMSILRQGLQLGRPEGYP